MKSVGRLAIVTLVAFGAGILFQRSVGLGNFMDWIGLPKGRESQSSVCARVQRLQALGIPSEAIVFIGDSLVEQHEWHEVFSGRKVVNRGVSGARIRDLIGAFDYSKSKAVFCMIGVNDLGQGVSLEEFQESYRLLLAGIGEHVRFHAISIPAIQRYGGKEIDADVIRKANTLIKELASRQEFHFVDIFEISFEHQAKFYTEDGLHLSAYGYEKIRKILLPYLQEDPK